MTIGFLSKDEGCGYYSRSHYYSHVLMGRVAYPLDPSAINVENFVSNEESQNN